MATLSDTRRFIRPEILERLAQRFEQLRKGVKRPDVSPSYLLQGEHYCETCQRFSRYAVCGYCSS